VTLPLANEHIQEEKLFQLMSGCLEVFKKEKVNLLGGHTSEAEELAIGLSVTGYVSEGDYFEKGKLKSGESLLLTKSLGTGALLAAHSRGLCEASSYQAMIQSMLLSQRNAIPVLKELGVKACTDVTGFGLAGHLIEMLKKSSVNARLQLSSLPLLPQVEKLMREKKIQSTLQPGNEAFAVDISGDTKAFPWLFDPQTSGGLLFSLESAKADMAVMKLRALGFEQATVIGEVLDSSETPLLHVNP
jgi:selenide,water dikinase